MRRRHFLGGLATLAGALAAGGCGSNNDAGAAPLPALPTNPQPQVLDAAFGRAFAHLRSTSIIAAVDGPGLQWTGRMGVNQHFDPHTRIGSVTKTITATAILQLVDQGLLGLDQTVESWFPQLPDAHQITIRMLGSMASGIANYTLNDQLVDAYFANPTQPIQRQKLLDAAFAEPRLFAPGQGFNYSNTNLIMLGEIVERISGLARSDFFQQRIFAPLGMNATSYPLTNELPEPYWSGLTLQGVSDDIPVDATHWTPTFPDAAGAVISRLDDMVTWTRALGQGTLLQPATQAQRLLPNPYSTKDGRSYLFGLGDEDGWLAHSGELPGYNTQVAYHPQTTRTIVVLANSDIPSDEKVDPAVAVFRELRAALSPT